MPGGLFEADTSFPNLASKKTADEKLGAVQDYLYMLLEMLRWTLRHLSDDNFDPAGAASLVESVGEQTPAVYDEIIKNVSSEFPQTFSEIITNVNTEYPQTFNDIIMNMIEEYPEVFQDIIVSETVITDELYSNYGEIADLIVDELRTDYQKAARYLNRNTAALDYLHIYDEQIDFVTGTVVKVNNVPQTEQLHHTFRVSGTQYFWWLDETKTKMTSRTETAWPVIVYQYNELLKGSFRFEDYTPPGGQLTKVPTLILGAGVGDPQDPDIGKGFIRKGTSSFDLWLHGAADNGVFIGQYTDIVGERKPTNINLSDWDSGEFTVMYDGNIAQNYYVVFDAGDRPTIIIDATGHETVVTWE